MLVEAFQDQAQLVLAEYTTASKLRFGKLLLLLPVLRTLNSTAVASSLFRTYGKSVDNLLDDMLKSCTPA